MSIFVYRCQGNSSYISEMWFTKTRGYSRVRYILYNRTAQNIQLGYATDWLGYAFISAALK